MACDRAASVVFAAFPLNPTPPLQFLAKTMTVHTTNPFVLAMAAKSAELVPVIGPKYEPI